MPEPIPAPIKFFMPLMKSAQNLIWGTPSGSTPRCGISSSTAKPALPRTISPKPFPSITSKYRSSKKTESPGFADYREYLTLRSLHITDYGSKLTFRTQKEDVASSFFMHKFFFLTYSYSCSSISSTTCSIEYYVL